MVSKASDDLPEPDRPVKTTSLSRGISRSMFLRLCSRAPRMLIARMPEPVCWRLALITSSISAFPGARQTRRIRARIAGSLRSDAGGDVRNIGRTRADFQCYVQAINGLLRNQVRWQQQAVAMQGCKQKDRREAGLLRFGRSIQAAIGISRRRDRQSARSILNTVAIAARPYPRDIADTTKNTVPKML